ncbi:MAG: hypothetical protein QGG84_06275, partial [Rhodospirillales bacterium]|nr:hypothetical protein [Rhodospirillales bacterium]
MIGDSVLRKEDYKFLTGRGRYVSDINIDKVRHAYIVRSPFAHAKITNVDIRKTVCCAGVAAVYTGADMAATCDGGPVPLWRAFILGAGRALAFGMAKSGARAYLA